MHYIDGVLTATPTANEEQFRQHAEQVAAIFHKHGAIRCVECWGDDIPTGDTTDFYRAVKAKDEETVTFSWIEWPDKATRDAGMKKVMEEMPEIMKNNPMPFDGTRMIFGGFRSILDSQE